LGLAIAPHFSDCAVQLVGTVLRIVDSTMKVNIYTGYKTAWYTALFLFPPPPIPPFLVLPPTFSYLSFISLCRDDDPNQSLLEDSPLFGVDVEASRRALGLIRFFIGLQPLVDTVPGPAPRLVVLLFRMLVHSCDYLQVLDCLDSFSPPLPFPSPHCPPLSLTPSITHLLLHLSRMPRISKSSPFGIT